jgi:hypothetical protein
MTISSQEAREQIAGDLAAASERLGFAVASLGEAYEQLSLDAADRLEETLFRPAQRAFGRCKRALAGYERSTGVSVSAPVEQPPGPPSLGARGFVEQAVLAAVAADNRIAELQDSMLPIEYGDAELRAALGEVRELLAELPVAEREFLRTLGR